MTHKTDKGSDGTPQNGQVQKGESDGMLTEYDFSGGIRGKHAQALQSGYTTIVHHPDGTVTQVVHLPRAERDEPRPQDAMHAPCITERYAIVHQPENAVQEPTLQAGAGSQMTAEVTMQTVRSASIVGGQTTPNAVLELGYFTQVLREPLTVVDQPQRNASQELVAQR